MADGRVAGQWGHRSLTTYASPVGPSECKTGVAFWASSDLPALSGGEAGPGVYVVLSGVIRRLHQRADGTSKVPACLLPAALLRLRRWWWRRRVLMY